VERDEARIRNMQTNAHAGDSPAARNDALAVAVVTQDDVMVHRVAAILAREGVVAQVERGGREQLSLRALHTIPAVVLLIRDAALPTSVAEVRRILRRLPNTHVVAVVRDRRTEDMRALLDAGVEGIVLEPDLDRALGLAIRAASGGQVSVPAMMMRQGVTAPALSFRERQILGLVTAGLTNDEIASQMYLAESTVKGHLTSAFRRLGVRSRREAVARILAADESLRRSILTATPGGAGGDQLRGRESR